ncbi:hypothetical protein [Herbaspirillum sp. YR522]|uniref:hypothetical protein n=1 Tax=Herbaspirillum sp. YR522 TaxID=1144342 RepID=UPI00059101B0|nr:hypothetical protein [Herbaspirillum sp. YR522]
MLFIALLRIQPPQQEPEAAPIGLMPVALKPTDHDQLAIIDSTARPAAPTLDTKTALAAFDSWQRRTPEGLTVGEAPGRSVFICRHSLFAWPGREAS